MDYRQKTIDGRNGGCSLFVLRLFMAAGMFSRAARGMEGGPRSGRAKGAAGARSTGAKRSPEQPDPLPAGRARARGGRYEM